MYQPYMNNFNPYQQRLSQMEQMAQSQPIQTIQPTTPQSQCYFVSSKDEMQNIQPVPNVFYIGINRKADSLASKGNKEQLATWRCGVGFVWRLRLNHDSLRANAQKSQIDGA